MSPVRCGFLRQPGQRVPVRRRPVPASSPAGSPPAGPGSPGRARPVSAQSCASTAATATASGPVPCAAAMSQHGLRRLDREPAVGQGFLDQHAFPGRVRRGERRPGRRLQDVPRRLHRREHRPPGHFQRERALDRVRLGRPGRREPDRDAVRGKLGQRLDQRLVGEQRTVHSERMHLVEADPIPQQRQGFRPLRRRTAPPSAPSPRARRRRAASPRRRRSPTCSTPRRRCARARRASRPGTPPSARTTGRRRRAARPRRRRRRAPRTSRPASTRRPAPAGGRRRGPG